MSKNYIWFSETNMIQCLSFKACYQILRQLYRHKFYCENECVIGNTLIFQLHKCNTDIIIYVHDKVYNMHNHETISYKDYINTLRRNKS